MSRMFETKEITKLLNVLIGNVEAVGETNEDNSRLDNLKTLIDVTNWCLDGLQFAMDSGYGRYESSMAEISYTAQCALNEYGAWITDILDEHVKGETMRLIDADKLKENFNNADAFRLNLELDRYAIKCIDNAPTIDPVRHGRWLYTEAWPHRVYCSSCYKTYAQKQWEVWEDGSLPRAYCPNCGAKMDGGKDEESEE